MRDTRQKLRCWGALLGALGALGAPAAGQPSSPEQSIGAVLAIPYRNYDFVLGFNGTRDLRVRTLHLSRYGDGTFKTEILTLGIVRADTGESPQTLFLPTNEAGEPLPIFQELNNKDRLVQQSSIALGDGKIHIAQIRLTQADTGVYLPERTRFFLAPSDGVESLRAANPGVKLPVVHLQQMAVGRFHVQAALMAIDQRDAGSLKLPTQALLNTLLQMNTNVTLPREKAGDPSSLTRGSRRTTEGGSDMKTVIVSAQMIF